MIRVIRRSASKSHTPKSRRSGVTTVELGLVILVFLMLVFGLVEMSVAIFKYHIVSQAARQGARQAIVRGEMASTLGEWDPGSLGDPYSVALSDNSAIPNLLRNYTQGIDPTQTTIQIDWLDGNNAVNSRVEYRVSTIHSPIITFMFTSNMTFVGEATMDIHH